MLIHGHRVLEYIFKDEKQWLTDGDGSQTSHASVCHLQNRFAPLTFHQALIQTWITSDTEYRYVLFPNVFFTNRLAK